MASGCSRKCHSKKLPLQQKFLRVATQVVMKNGCKKQVAVQRRFTLLATWYPTMLPLVKKDH